MNKKNTEMKQFQNALDSCLFLISLLLSPLFKFSFFFLKPMLSRQIFDSYCFLFFFSSFKFLGRVFVSSCNANSIFAFPYRILHIHI